MKAADSSVLIAAFGEARAQSHREFVLSLPEHGTTGGAVYDALVAATVARHGHSLVSCDRRAASTYERYGIRFEIL